MASANVLLFREKKDSGDLFLCRLNRSWPEEDLVDVCLVRLGETSPGQLICLICDGYRLVSFLLHIFSDGSIDIKGQSGKITHLLKEQFEIEGYVESL